MTNLEHYVKHNCQAIWEAMRGSKYRMHLKLLTGYLIILTMKEIDCLSCGPRTTVNAAAKASAWAIDIDTESETMRTPIIPPPLCCMAVGSRNSPVTKEVREESHEFCNPGHRRKISEPV